MSFKEILFEGKYLYLQNGKDYSEENFTVHVDDNVQGNYHYESEVVSRVKTGEFLQIKVIAELSNRFDPIRYEIQRTLGKKVSTELFTFDSKKKLVQYEFNGLNGKHNYEKMVNGKLHIATPCFVLSTVMINSKKIDSVHRTTYNVVTSNNIWTYEEPFFEHDIHFELRELKQIPLLVNDIELKATHCQIVHPDPKTGVISDERHDIYLSKYNFIPYKATFSNGIEILVENLKSFEDKRTKF